MYFPTAGIECSPLVPFAAALGVSFFTSMGGVSGAFLLLPFQMSVLGYTNPSVSATNQFFNVLARRCLALLARRPPALAADPDGGPGHAARRVRGHADPH
jgi:hypothetical protein